jgi:hypothetical protein
MSTLPDSGTLPKPLRFASFASFFKSYMNVSTVIVASIPIPVAKWDLIPLYAQQKGFLTVYASLFCFLLLAFVFFIRHSLAKRMFSAGRWASLTKTLPLLFIATTLGCILAYHATLGQSLQQLRNMGAMVPTSVLLKQTDYAEIPRSLALAAFYLGIFVFAEAALVLMALREYLQDVLRLDEVTLLKRVRG